MEDNANCIDDDQNHLSSDTMSSPKSSTPPDPSVSTPPSCDAPPVSSSSTAANVAASASQGSTGQQSTHATGNRNSSHRYPSSRHQRSGRYNSIGPPPYHIPSNYQQLAMPQFFQPMVPGPYVGAPEYPDQPIPLPFQNLETLPFVPPPRGDPSRRRPSGQASGRHMNHMWRNNNMPLHRDMGPRPPVVPMFPPSPGFIPDPTFSGPPLYYVPLTPPAPIAGFPSPTPVNLGTPPLSQETIVLRSNIVRQIEYYFSDENLQTDRYLISRMDDQGWVSISLVANFNRVKRMTTDIPFILDSLQSSATVEVQGDKIRKRENWAKWIQTSNEHALSSKSQIHSDDGKRLSPDEAVQDVSDLCNDFGSTILLDKELEPEEKLKKNDGFSSASRNGDEENEKMVQEGERLAINTHTTSTDAN